MLVADLDLSGKVFKVEFCPSKYRLLELLHELLIGDVWMRATRVKSETLTEEPGDYHCQMEELIDCPRGVQIHVSQGQIFRKFMGRLWVKLTLQTWIVKVLSDFKVFKIVRLERSLHIFLA